MQSDVVAKFTSNNDSLNNVLDLKYINRKIKNFIDWYLSYYKMETK